METLISFLKFSSVFDWLVMFLTLALFLISIVLLMVLRSSKPFYLVIVAAVFPLIGGLLATFFKLQQLQRAQQMVEAIGFEGLGRARDEAWMITYVGAVGAMAIATIGLLGLLLKRRASDV